MRGWDKGRQDAARPPYEATPPTQAGVRRPPDAYASRRQAAAGPAVIVPARLVPSLRGPARVGVSADLFHGRG
jgi:hypothetical protein